MNTGVNDISPLRKVVERFFAVELRILQITVQPHDDTRTVHEVAAHYDGTLTEAEARARYSACNAILCAPSGEGV